MIPSALAMTSLLPSAEDTTCSKMLTAEMLVNQDVPELVDRRIRVLELTAANLLPSAELAIP